MAGAHEQLERAEHAEHAAHGHGPSSTNKRIALLIAILALFLAISETLGKGAQTEALNYNVEASNLWAFFQAKTIRQTVGAHRRRDRRARRGRRPPIRPSPRRSRNVSTHGRRPWRAGRPNPRPRKAARSWRCGPRQAETKRDTSLARYHHYEVASAAFQIAIVLASAAVITSAMVLAFVAIGLGAVGLVFTAIGLLAPHSVHLF